ncbi:hypothetical protein [Picosynechococcus sp. NKBG15041c]|uniref:hypothetical protein n=1 Tax=Picosynechococcus sp. NKBG15041c TaxID=1407650 RepID=UPI0011DE15F2|nr:hypothetical protein [Picosynechococcus sp. NKBG15041c]
MKKIFIISLISFFSLNFGCLKPVNAQQSCQSEVDSVIRDIKSKGTSVDYEIIRNGSPIRSNRRIDRINFRLNSRNSFTPGRAIYVAENILNSEVLMKSYANQIFSRCGGTGNIVFGLSQTDWIERFIMTDNGTLGYEICGDHVRTAPNKLTNTYYFLSNICTFIIPNF